MEIFKDIPGYEGKYQISNYGRIFGLVKKIERKFTLNESGYHRILLQIKKQHKTFLVHRLVMLTFVGPSDLTVNHIDGNKLNNMLKNLEYCTSKENTKHAWRTGLCKPFKGENHGNSKLNDKQVRNVKMLLNDGLTQRKIAKIYGVSQKLIYLIKHNRNWSHI